MAKIKVYTLPTCPWCMKLKAWLVEKKIDFENIDVSSDSSAVEEMTSKSGELGVPQTEINGKMIVGFVPEEIEAELAKMSKTKKTKK
jgi:glutaredoxin-like YruB-family protein